MVEIELRILVGRMLMIKKKKTPSLRRQLEIWSKKVRERDGNKCVLCGSTEHLNAHHLMPKKFWKDYRLELNNGITLCCKCHSFGKWSVHRGVGDYELFCFLQKNRPEQWNWYSETVTVERYLEQKGYGEKK